MTDRVYSVNIHGDGSTTIATSVRDINNYSTINSRPLPEPIFFNVESPDTNFVGRKTELSRLENTMNNTSPNTSAVKNMIVVTGLGGIGKTQLIRKFIEVNRTSYKNVIWIHSESAAKNVDSFKRLAEGRLNISTTHENGKEKDLNSIVELVFNRLSVNKTLIVYDNVDEIKDIKSLLTIQASGTNLDVLITSRIQKWGNQIDVVQLKVWELDDAVEYVSTTLTDDETLHNDSQGDKMSLVEKLQAFPLALKQATAYVNHQREVRVFRIADYITIYNTQKVLDSKLFHDEDALNNYEKTTFTTWRVTIEAIARNGTIGPLAIRILKIIAFFDPDKIRRDIFIHLTFEPEDMPIDHEENVVSAVRLLVNYSMVDSQKLQSVLSIHRLVQQVTKLELENTRNEGKSVMRDCLLLIPKLIDNNKLHENHSHAVSVFLSALKFSDLVNEFSDLSCSILKTLIYSGKYNRAQEFGDKIRLPLMDILGEDHPDTLTTKSEIAHSYFKQGMFTQALEMYQEALEKMKNILGEDHPDTLTTEQNIAYSYMQLGKHTKALGMFQEVFETTKNILGEDHPDTLTTEHNIAYLYLQEAKYTEALGMFQEIFEERKNIFGDDHTDTLESKSYIAHSFSQLGKHTEALKMYQEVVEKRTNILGEDHPDSLAIKSNIADTYSELRKHTEALQIYKDVFEKRTNILGEDHPDTVASKSYIADAYRQLGKHTEALKMYKEVFEKRADILGVDHPDTVTTKSYIADVYRQLGKHTEALRIFQEVFEKRTNVLGEDHLDTLASKSYIADSYSQLGKHTEALQIYKEVFEKRADILGVNHPDTVTTKSDIADEYSELRKHTEALQMYKKVYEKRTNILEEDHPDTLASKYNIAYTYSRLGKHIEALRMFRDVFEKQTNIFGEDHLYTLASKFNITYSCRQLRILRQSKCIKKSRRRSFRVRQ